MPRIQIKRHQTLLDFAVQHTGKIDGWVQTALLNNSSITEDVLPGSILNIGPVQSVKNVDYFIDSQKEISSLLNRSQVDNKEGIGYWIIGLNFIVS